MGDASCLPNPRVVAAEFGWRLNGGEITNTLSVQSLRYLGIPVDAVCSVDVTNQCNLRCHHCYFFEHEQPEDLAVKRWGEFFEKLKAEGFPFFSCTWVGGEPLMRKK